MINFENGDSVFRAQGQIKKLLHRPVFSKARTVRAKARFMGKTYFIIKGAFPKIEP